MQLRAQLRPDASFYLALDSLTGLLHLFQKTDEGDKDH